MIWMSGVEFDLNENYLIKIANLATNTVFEKIDFKKDINTFKEFQSNELKLNDIAKCTLTLNKKIFLKAYKDNKTLGSFIIIDKYPNEILATGMVEENLTREEKIRTYAQAEIELNAYIGKSYSEWECKTYKIIVTLSILILLILLISNKTNLFICLIVFILLLLVLVVI